MYTKLRLSLMEIVLFALVFVIGWALWHVFRTVREIDQTPSVLTRVQQDYLDMAKHIEQFEDQSHAALVDMAVYNNRDARPRFEESERNFRLWLATERERLMRSKIVMVQPIRYTVDMGGFLDNVQRATDIYVAECQRMFTGPGVVLGTKGVAAIAGLKGQQLVRLANQAHAEAGAIELFSTGSRRWFGWIRRLMLVALLALFVSAVWLSALVYRRVVFPLRRQLVEAQAIVDRQQKLSHFGELAAIVAHEIRNPLTAIRARLYTLERTLAPGTPEHADAAMIGNEINRLNRIVQDFLESARPSLPQLVPMSAVPLLQQVQKLLGASCEKHSIKLEVEEIVEDIFQGDIHQLSQVLINLVQNAADSIGQNGTIRLRARHDQRRIRNRSAEMVVMEVEDDGPGIPGETQRRLFDPFFSTKKGGTGLGLSIAARIVTRHSGSIEFASRPGGPTVFGIVLPVNPTSS